MAISRALHVLVVDDDAGVLESYRRILDGFLRRPPSELSDVDALSAELFGGEPDPSSDAGEVLFEEVVYRRQGEQAVREVETALRRGRPFAVVFLDMRMPPGIDGLETARRIRSLDPRVNIVVVTGYSDHKPADIAAAAGGPERLFYLMKPFDAGELQQFAVALATRWSSDLGAAEELATRVAELERVNAALAASEAHAKEIARLDPLTGLANRTSLRERFAGEAAAAGARGQRLSLVYLDLDHFKLINDRYGHAVGDELIREFAARLRQATGAEGFAARLGGDEFMVISSDHKRTAALVDRLVGAFGPSFQVFGQEIGMGVSIGIAHSDAGRPDFTETIRRADIALYAAKAQGRGAAAEFNPALDREFLAMRQLENELAAAVVRDELMLHYQPMVHASGGPIHGVEALLRWTHPTRGAIPPSEVIAVAERTGIIRPLGDWVIDRAFADARLWPSLVTSINLSPAQLRDPAFAERLIAMAAETRTNPAMVEIEITETFLIEDIDLAASQMRRLKNAGFQIALDDFGSGYASLGYLSRIPFDRLKIDRSFVQNLGSGAGAEGIVRSIVGLAKAMGLSTTAEGVEDPLQHRLLVAAGCDLMQGFLFHRPLPRDQILALLGERREARLLG
jgi:diguanylate cyclase (GGDEF)-like protein